MNLKSNILFFILLMSCGLFAQNDKSDKEKLKIKQRTQGKVDFGFSGLGLSIETPASENILLEFAAGLGAAYQVNEDFKYRFYFDDPAFFATAHGKYYYIHTDQEKTNPLNSGNFFGIKVKYASPTLRNEKMWHTLLTGFHWGLQRRLGNHFLYQLDLGVGAAIDIDSKTTTKMTLFPDANFRFSYVLPF